MRKDSYSTEFFEVLRDNSRTSAEIVVPLVCELLKPASVVDIGCGTGEWLDTFDRQGVSDYLGVDGAYVDRKTIPETRFVAQDLWRSCSLGRTFDLAMSLEVAEHLPVARARSFVADLVRLAPAVLFSAAIPGQGGVEHINEQWQSWWADLFAEHGYVARDVVRPVVWDDDRVAFYYRQNAIVYLRDGAPTETILNVVHPTMLEYVRPREPRPPGLRESLAQLPAAARRTFRYRFGARRVRNR